MTAAHNPQLHEETDRDLWDDIAYWSIVFSMTVVTFLFGCGLLGYLVGRFL